MDIGSRRLREASSMYSRSSLEKNLLRLGYPTASVVRASMTRWLPLTVPKRVSMPMMAVMMSGSTP